MEKRLTFLKFLSNLEKFRKVFFVSSLPFLQNRVVFPQEQSFLRCNLRTGNISITWEHTKNTCYQEFLLWHNRIRSILGMLECSLNPLPAQWVKGYCVAAAVAWVTTTAWIWSLAQELHMPWGSQKRKKKNTNQTHPVSTESEILGVHLAICALTSLQGCSCHGSVVN